MAFNLDDALKEQAFQHLRTDVQVPWRWAPTEGNFQGYQQDITNFGNQFNTLFENLVGRAPTQDEMNRYVTDFVIPNTNNIAQPNSQFRQTIRDQLGQFVGDNFQRAAQQNVEQQLQSQTGEANRLADLFRTQGRQAINDTEQSLLDYQQKLFDKLRPNLLTSLQAQGLLNTGGLNEAVAGAQEDLATEGSNYLRDARLQNEQQANAIAFSGAEAPYQFRVGQIMNQVPQLQAQAQQASDRGFQTFLQNLQYQQQLGLLQAQKQQQPSFLKSLGQSFLGGLAQSFNPLSASQAYQNYQTGNYYGGYSNPAVYNKGKVS